MHARAHMCVHAHARTHNERLALRIKRVKIIEKCRIHVSQNYIASKKNVKYTYTLNLQ